MAEGGEFKWSTCDACGAEEKPGGSSGDGSESVVKLKACSRCKKTHYCNKACQKCAPPASPSLNLTCLPAPRCQRKCSCPATPPGRQRHTSPDPTAAANLLPRAHWKAHKPNCINTANVVPTAFAPPVGKMAKFSAGIVW